MQIWSASFQRITGRLIFDQTKLGDGLPVIASSGANVLTCFVHLLRFESPLCEGTCLHTQETRSVKTCLVCQGVLSLKAVCYHIVAVDDGANLCKHKDELCPTPESGTKGHALKISPPLLPQFWSSQARVCVCVQFVWH